MLLSKWPIKLSIVYSSSSQLQFRPLLHLKWLTSGKFITFDSQKSAVCCYNLMFIYVAVSGDLRHWLLRLCTVQTVRHVKLNENYFYFLSFAFSFPRLLSFRGRKEFINFYIFMCCDDFGDTFFNLKLGGILSHLLTIILLQLLLENN